MGGNSNKIDEILELVHFIVDFIQTKVATKEELSEVRRELHEEISDIRIEVSGVRNEISGIRKDVSDVCNEITDHVDKFIGLHKCLETETYALKSAVHCHEGYFDHISNHLKLDLKNS